MNQIAERLVELRKESGLSQEQLAERLYVSRQAVGKWERAEGLPDIENLLLLSRLYGVSMDSLLNPDDADENSGTAKINEKTKTKRGKALKDAFKFSAVAVLCIIIGLFSSRIGAIFPKDDNNQHEQNEGEAAALILVQYNRNEGTLNYMYIDDQDRKFFTTAYTGDPGTLPGIMYSYDVKSNTYYYILTPSEAENSFIVTESAGDTQ